jgi:hypothetical protein
MPALSTQRPTIADVAKRLDPDGSVAKIAEVLEQLNPVLADAPAVQGNLPTGHRSTRRTSLGAASWRGFNEGVTPVKSTTEQVQDVTAMLTRWHQVDKKVADLNGNTAEFRLSELTAALQDISQEFEDTFFYGNHGENENQFDGLARRYAVPNQQVLDAGSNDSDNASIFLVGWGEPVHLIYPKGSTAGIQHVDHGLQIVENTNGVAGALMSGYVDEVTLDIGLHVKDPRYVVRTGSIDISVLAGTSPADLLTLMTKMIWRIPNMSACRPVFYMNRSIAQYLDIQRQSRMENSFRYEEVDGKWVPMFRNVPIHISDALANDETAV